MSVTAILSFSTLLLAFSSRFSSSPMSTIDRRRSCSSAPPLLPLLLSKRFSIAASFSPNCCKAVVNSTCCCWNFSTLSTFFVNTLKMLAVKSILKYNPTSSLPRRLKHALPDLPFDYNALEPVIATEIMQIHHQKHHATYVNNLNIAEEKTQEALAKGDIRTAIQLQSALKFNGGGHINHCIFWTNLCKDGGEPDGQLLQQIKKDFGSVQAMQDKLNAMSIAIQGSGWGWLGYNKNEKRLELACCPNQDPLEPTTGLVPLFGIDVWEHAYYLQYKNVRADYVKAIWKIANWKNVEERFMNGQKA